MLVRTRYILLLYLLIFSLFAYSEKSANRDSLQLICEQATKVSDHRRALEIAIELKIAHLFYSFIKDKMERR